MASNLYLARANSPDAITMRGRWTGAAAANLTKVTGSGLSIARQGVGVHRLSWDQVGAQLDGLPVFGLAANTPSAIDRYTVIADFDSYSAANRTIDFTIFDETGAPADLAATSALGIILPLSLSRLSG